MMLVQFVLISGIVWLFCATLYVLSEVTGAETTTEFCRRLNQAVMIEWMSQILTALGLLLGGYLWFGTLMLPVGVWHAVKHCQRGDFVSPHEVAKAKFRDSKTRFYTAKLAYYGLIFVALAFHMGVMLVDSLMSHPLHNLLDDIVVPVV